MSESAPRISDEAVVELAKALYAECPHLGTWNEIGDEWQSTYREKATAILPLLCGGLEEELHDLRVRAEDRQDRLEAVTRDRDEKFVVANRLLDERKEVEAALEKAEQEVERLRDALALREEDDDRRLASAQSMALKTSKGGRDVR